MANYLPEGMRIDLPANRRALSSLAALQEAQAQGSILEGRAVICDSGHNLVVELGALRGLIPGRRGRWASPRAPPGILRSSPG